MKHEFEHSLLPQINLKRDDSGVARKYVSDNGTEYQSVTSLLSKLPKKQKILREWRARVGEAEANRISAIASNRGSRIHNIIEKRLLNDPDWRTGANSLDLAHVAPIIKILQDNVGTIFGVEHQMCSDQLKIAGTTDLLCQWQNQPAIVDFKTSKYPKKKLDIIDYFLQGGAYGVMLQELYGITPANIVIIMHVDHDKPKLFVESAPQFMEAAMVAFPKLIAMK